MRKWIPAGCLLVFAALNVSAQENNPPADIPSKPPTVSEPAQHPTQSPGMRKLSRRERRDRLRNLSDKYHDFLREVEPIMLPAELNTFLLLESDPQRDLYIDTFWKVRDPDPMTPRNEYRETYAELLVEAKEKFRSLSSDRGRVYLTRGRPAEIVPVTHCDRYLQPIEIWVYTHDFPGTRGVALLVFYFPRIAPDYRLWMPMSGSRSDDLKELLSVEGEMRSDTLSWDDLFACRNVELLQRALAWANVNRFLVAQVFEPPQIETEDVGKILRSAVISTPGAPELPASLTVRHPGKRGSRTSVEMTLQVSTGSLGEKLLNEQAFYNFDVNGEILKEGKIFETFRYRFDFPAEPPETTLPLVVERFLRPDLYQARIKIVDVNSGAESILEREIEVPPVTIEVTESERQGAQTLERIQHEFRQGESRLRIVPLPDEILTGLQKIETLISGNDIATVEFYLDGKKIMTKRQPPYELDLDFGRMPMMRRVRVVGLDAGGRTVTGDEILVNTGSDPFRVHIVSPRVTGDVSGKVRVEVNVRVPENKSLKHLELYLNETRLTALFDPPFVQTIDVPDDLGIGYLRAVAHLDDEAGSVSEDIVFLNTPEFLQEVDVHLVELPTTVVRRGRPVSDLPLSAFRVYDEGTPIEIAKFEYVRDLPLAVGVAIDSSGSMRPRMLQAQKAGAEFFSRVLKPGDKGFVVAFDARPSLVQKWSDDLSALTAGLASLRAEEMTALYDAVIYSLYNFQGIRGQKALILLSDGHDTASEFQFDQALEYARRAGVPIYTVGVGIRTSDMDVRQKLNRLARETGGNAYYIRAAGELAGIYGQIETELRSQYILGIYPPEGVKSGDAWRNVRVEVAEGEAKTISGYYP